MADLLIDDTEETIECYKQYRKQLCKRYFIGGSVSVFAIRWSGLSIWGDLRSFLVEKVKNEFKGKCPSIYTIRTKRIDIGEGVELKLEEQIRTLIEADPFNMEPIADMYDWFVDVNEDWGSKEIVGKCYTPGLVVYECPVGVIYESLSQDKRILHGKKSMIVQDFRSGTTRLYTNHNEELCLVDHSHLRLEASDESVTSYTFTHSPKLVQTEDGIPITQTLLNRRQYSDGTKILFSKEGAVQHICFSIDVAREYGYKSAEVRAVEVDKHGTCGIDLSKAEIEGLLAMNPLSASRLAMCRQRDGPRLELLVEFMEPTAGLTEGKMSLLESNCNKQGVLESAKEAMKAIFAAETHRSALMAALLLNEELSQKEQQSRRREKKARKRHRRIEKNNVSPLLEVEFHALQIKEDIEEIVDSAIKSGPVQETVGRFGTDIEIDKVPQELVCPITLELYIEPVVLADGHTFEKESIVRWFRHHETNPMTGVKVEHKQLVPNLNVRNMCRDFCESLITQ